MLNAKRTGFALATMGAVFHLVWSILVALGLAQPLMDFIVRIHMLETADRVTDFSLSNAVLLIIVTSIIWGVFGYVFATIWNKLQK